MDVRRKFNLARFRLFSESGKCDNMAAAIRSFRAAESCFDQGDPEAFRVTNAGLTEARDRISLINHGASGRQPREFVLPWLRRGREGLRCAG